MSGRSPTRRRAFPKGGSLLEVSSSRSGGSVYQDVPLIAVPGQSYTFSIWVRSAATTKANVCVVLWGIGSGIQVHGQTCALVSTTWTQLSAPLDVDTAGLADLRAQVYLHTSNIKVDLTGSALVNDGLSSASFENNATTGWTTQSPRGATTRALAEKAPGLPEDGHLLKLGTSRPGGSVYQDVPASLAPNQSYTFSIWLRSNAPSKERVCVVLWGLGGTAAEGPDLPERRADVDPRLGALRRQRHRAPRSPGSGLPLHRRPSPRPDRRLARRGGLIDQSAVPSPASRERAAIVRLRRARQILTASPLPGRFRNLLCLVGRGASVTPAGVVPAKRLQSQAE